MNTVTTVIKTSNHKRKLLWSCHFAWFDICFLTFSFKLRWSVWVWHSIKLFDWHELEVRSFVLIEFIKKQILKRYFPPRSWLKDIQQSLKILCLIYLICFIGLFQKLQQKSIVDIFDNWSWQYLFTNVKNNRSPEQWKRCVCNFVDIQS